MSEVSELSRIRHDLKNFLTAMRSGCLLIEAELGEDEHSSVRGILNEMRAELERGAALAEKLGMLASESDKPTE